MTNKQHPDLRTHLVALLEGGHAFAKPQTILENIPATIRGRRPDGFDHSLWELIEHLRISQRDILDFCVADEYIEHKWPDEYWPATAEPPSAAAWDESVAAFLADIDETRRLAVDESIDLLSVVPHGTTQTYLREILLIAEHNAHHLGQVIAVRKLLGTWR